MAAARKTVLKLDHDIVTEMNADLALDSADDAWTGLGTPRRR
jgi:hypothetical protein